MAKKKKPAPTPTPEPKYPIIFETFREVGNWEKSTLRSDTPSCLNGWVNYRKYKITFELVEEPKEVLEKRLEMLWVTGYNMHHYTPLQIAASKIGYTFKGNFGEKRSNN